MTQTESEELMNWSEEAASILSDTMNKFFKEEKEYQIKEILKDPEKHRLTSFMKNLGYYPFYVLEKNIGKKNQITHAWCMTKHKNIAGYYLIWYEIYEKRTTKRSNFTAEKKRKDALDYCKRMYNSKRVLKKSEIFDNLNKTL